MSDKKNLIWLASYPKSGNTWIRILLSNYLSDQSKPIDINKIDSSIISSSRVILDNQIPFLASDLKYDEIDIIRPLLYQTISKENDDYVFIKTHDAFTKNVNGKDIFPLDVTKYIIHIVRNPLDVCVSYAHHSNISIDRSIKSLNNPKLCLSSSQKSLSPQLRQKLLSWSEHYESWKSTDASYILVRYEDLLENTELVFRDILQKIYGKVDETKMLLAINNASFDKLKKQESENDFKERPLKAKAFFRKGIAGSWLNEMSEEQIQELTKHHKEIIKELHY